MVRTQDTEDGLSDDREMGLRDWAFADLRDRCRWSHEHIAKAFGVSERTVHRGIKAYKQARQSVTSLLATSH